MNNLIFSLNSTLPIFIVIIIGYVLGQKKFLTKEFCSVADKLVFRVGLPAMLFCDMTSIDLTENFNGKFVLFCFGVTAISIIVIWTLARIFLRDKSLTGEFVQACYRSSAAILGVAFIQNIYGTSGMAPLMMLGSVPLFNIFAVLILTIENPSHKGKLHPDQPDSGRHSDRYYLQSAAHRPAGHGSEDIQHSWKSDHSTGAPFHRSFFRRCQGNQKTGTHRCSVLLQTNAVRYDIPSHCNQIRLPRTGAHRSAHYAGQSYHSGILCHVKKYGTRRYPLRQLCCSNHSILRCYHDIMDLCPKCWRISSLKDKKFRGFDHFPEFFLFIIFLCSSIVPQSADHLPLHMSAAYLLLSECNPMADPVVLLFLSEFSSSFQAVFSKFPLLFLFPLTFLF